MFDIVYSRSVWEHLTDPEKVMSEVGRVLKPGGLLILTTPNKYDYTSLVARLTPQWFHVGQRRKSDSAMTCLRFIIAAIRRVGFGV
jgi:2-polyprenyl-3-methyl-5-hydroxy-6-metoxy-1,4-benzoquinol methylase